MRVKKIAEKLHTLGRCTVSLRFGFVLLTSSSICYFIGDALLPKVSQRVKHARILLLLDVRVNYKKPFPFVREVSGPTGFGILKVLPLS